jgi:DNA-binding NarL/FixJ family response regulator
MERSLRPAEIRVAVRDSSRMSCQLLCAALAREPSFEVIGVEAKGNAEIAAAKPHVVLINADAQSRWCELLDQLSRNLRETRSILLVEESTRELVVKAFRSGARGVFSRSESFDWLFKCITRVHSGHIWANQTEIKYLLEAISQPFPMPLVDAKGGLLLSQREQNIVACVVEGLTNREIAEQLKLSEHTVKNYLFRIFDKLGISRRVELILYVVSQLHPATAARTDSSQEEIRQTALLAAAPKDDELWTFSPYRLAESYREGRGAPFDKVAAFMWFKVAEAIAGEVHGNSKLAQQKLKAAMTPEQIDEAQRRATERLQHRPSGFRIAAD